MLTLKAVFALMLISFPFSQAQAREFLKKSEALRGRNLHILVAEVKRGTVVVTPDEGIPEQGRKYLLGSDGKLHELEGSLKDKSGKKDDGCGGTVDVAVLKPRVTTQATGNFVIFGPMDAQKHITWVPGQIAKRKALPKCAHYKPDFKPNRLLLYSVAGLKEKVYLSEWETPEDAKTTECGTRAAETVGLYDEKSDHCTQLNVYERDCDGMPENKTSVSTQDFIGMLKIGTEETWLIFRSVGFESSGFTALRLTKGNQINKSQTEELHDIGC